jgi:uncharacterized protein
MSTVLITGASSGIGAEFARQFHARGAELVLVARRVERLQQLADGFNQARPASARLIATDLTKTEGLKRLVDFISQNQIDVLVNNAGRGSFGCFESLPLEEEIEMVNLNICATLTLSHAVIPQMKSRKSGAIISLSSIAAFQPLPFMATYAATKAFNFVHSLALHFELASFGVKVLTVCPGPTGTEFGGVARAPGKLTATARDRVVDVVSQSLRALDGGSAWVVPGSWRSSCMSVFSRFLPKQFTAWLLGKILYSSLKEVKGRSS